MTYSPAGLEGVYDYGLCAQTLVLRYKGILPPYELYVHHTGLLLEQFYISLAVLLEMLWILLPTPKPGSWLVIAICPFLRLRAVLFGINTQFG